MNIKKYKTEKLVPIDLPKICAPRTELMKLYKKASLKRYIFINAPAGFGKTISTILWLKKSDYRTIWISLDEYDNIIAGFYRILCMALFSVIHHEETLDKLLKSPSFSAAPVEYTIEIISQLFFDDCSYALVFDDFHFITNEKIIKSLLYVIKRLPLSFAIYTLSRSELPQEFSQWEENDKIARIGASELSFKSVEIRRHFASCGQTVSIKEAEEAFNLTGGWPIAVNALVMGGNLYADERLHNNPLQKYIKHHIWDKLDKNIRIFMMQTSIVDNFSAELCHQITENTDSSRILNTILGSNMFLSCQESKYKYHHLFLDFLRNELISETSIDCNVLNQRAATYYYNSGDYFNALCFYIKSGCSKGVADSIFRYIKYNVQSSSDMFEIYYINKLSAEFLDQNPCLYISCALCALLFGDGEELFFHLDRLYGRIKDIAAINKAFLENAVFLYTVDPRYTFIEQFYRLKSDVLLDVNPSNIPKIISHNIPYFHRAYRDFSHYAQNTEENLAEFRHVFLSLLGSDYDIIESGIRSALLYEQNQIHDALALVSLNPITDSPELIFLSKMQIAVCLNSMGKEVESAQLRKEIAALLKTNKILYLLPVLSAYETKLRLLDGDKAAAKEWLENYFITESYNPQLHKIFLHFTTIRAYVALGEYDKAKTLCQKIWKLCTDYHRVLDAAEAAVLLAVIMQMTGNKQEAYDILQKTLSDMEPYGYIRVFADEGKSILPILKKLVKKADIESTTDVNKRVFLKKVYIAAYEQSKRYKGIATSIELKAIKLSRQQKHILEFLAKGYKNAEVVELTGLSINTVRYHTKMAYQKLNVNNVMDAVIKAKDLELILN